MTPSAKDRDGDPPDRTIRSPAEELKAGLIKTPIAEAYMLCLWANDYTVQSATQAERLFGLNRDDCNVLITLGIFGALTASEICAFNGRPKNSISRAVTRVFEGHLIARQSELGDKRRVQLSLTPSGLALFETIMPLFVKRQEAMLGSLTSAERGTLLRLMQKVMGNTAEWQHHT